MKLEDHITYPVWCAMIDARETAGLVDALPAALKKPFEKLFSQLHAAMLQLAEETRTDWAVIAKAFATKSVYGLLKAVAFSVGRIFAALKAFASVYEHGLLAVFKAIHKTKAFERLRSGALTLDAFLNQYPLLKKLAGPAVAGFLIWCFLHANFTWHPDLDMDFTVIIQAAFHGNWSIEQLLLTPQALLSLTTLFTALAGIPLVAPIWLAGSVRSVLVALFYTGLKSLKNSTTMQAIAARVQKKLSFTTL